MMSVSRRAVASPGRDEILFESDFEQVHREPKITTSHCKEDVGDLRHISIPVMNLLHVTHKKEADKITNGSAFEFKPFPKLARRNHGTWKKNAKEARYIEVIGKVFPGYYSWWSVHLSRSTPRGRGYTTHTDIEEAITALKSKRLNVRISNYLKEKPESIYGSCAFESDFLGLLASYIKSRSPKDSNRSIGDICIRMGGTLTYKFELCYVLIVSTTDDDDKLSKFAVLHDSELFHTNGFVDDEGRVAAVRNCLTFHPKHNVTWISGNACNYETAAFAFYFPDSDHVMTLDACLKWPITHNNEKCIRKERNNKCPDKS